MIAYDLACRNSHKFEGWFEDAEAFELQRSKGLVVCPFCDDTNVDIVPSRFAIRTYGAGPVSSGCDKGTASEEESLLRKAAEFLEKHFEDVGPNFSKEALKMHYGVTEKRSIRGTSSEQEESMLNAEGIKFLKIPIARMDS